LRPTTSGHVPAPGLIEVAGAWWDVDREPVVAWSADACSFWLHDTVDATLTLELVRLTSPPEDPRRVAQVLATGLAGCDFPPTGNGADPAIVARTLAAHGL
jgi:hypothetical protein